MAHNVGEELNKMQLKAMGKSIRRLEKELADLKALLNTTNGNLQLAEGRANTLELRYNALKAENEKFKQLLSEGLCGRCQDKIFQKLKQAIGGE